MNDSIYEIRRLCANNALYWTDHIAKRLIQRNIMPQEVKSALMNGEIIEEYPKDYPFPSFLVLGYNDVSSPLHVVCSIGNNQLFIITAYRPDPLQWDSRFKHRSNQEG